MRALLAAFLLTSALLLSGCATTSRTVSPAVPDALLTCAAEPQPPTDTSNSRKVAIYIVDLHDAGEDCRSKLGAVKKVLTK